MAWKLSVLFRMVSVRRGMLYKIFLGSWRKGLWPAFVDGKMGAPHLIDKVFFVLFTEDCAERAAHTFCRS